MDIANEKLPAPGVSQKNRILTSALTSCYILIYHNFDFAVLKSIDYIYPNYRAIVYSRSELLSLSDIWIIENTV